MTPYESVHVPPQLSDANDSSTMKIAGQDVLRKMSRHKLQVAACERCCRVQEDNRRVSGGGRVKSICTFFDLHGSPIKERKTAYVFTAPLLGHA